MATTLTLDGSTLSLPQILSFMADPDAQVYLSESARERVRKSREQVDAWVAENTSVIYGINTGLGRLIAYRVGEDEQEIFQENILNSHAAGVGDYFPDDIARLAMLLRANIFCRGHSGVRPELIDRLLTFINRGIFPLVPQIGSLGIGDLQPMAHLGLSLSGAEEGRISYHGISGSAPDQLRNARVPVTFKFAAKEALSLMDGSTVVLAASIYAYSRAMNLIKLADNALALSLEATRGEKNAFDERIHLARNIAGQVETAGRVRELIRDSEFINNKLSRTIFGETVTRVQDPVSFRSSPQVHGAVKESLRFIESVLEREINASNDNPLMFNKDGEDYECLSGGNYHGALLAYSQDLLGIVLTDLAVISERRSTRLLDPTLSFGLPPQLAGGAVGLNSGFGLIQASATALVGEMRVLATPSSVGSIPSKNNQEDHNSMGMGSVRHALQITEHLETVVAIELICSSQAIHLILERLQGLKLGHGTAQLYRLIRSKVPAVARDVYARDLIDRMLQLIREGSLLEPAAPAVPVLATMMD